MGSYNSNYVRNNIIIIAFILIVCNIRIIKCNDLIRTRVLRNTTLFLSQINCTDIDNDVICDNVDNCPNIYNPFQSDIDNDGVGDICDPNPMIYNPPFNYYNISNCTSNSDCNDNSPCTLDLCINSTCINLFDLSLNSTCEVMHFIHIFF